MGNFHHSQIGRWHAAASGAAATTTDQQDTSRPWVMSSVGGPFLQSQPSTTGYTPQDRPTWPFLVAHVAAQPYPSYSEDIDQVRVASGRHTVSEI